MSEIAMLPRNRATARAFGEHFAEVTPRFAAMFP